MHCHKFLSLVGTTVTVLLFGTTVKADTSLFLPGFDPQPISAGVVGTGSDGRTTWRLQQGTATGSQTLDPNNFPATATLIEGPSDAVFSLVVNTQTVSDGVTVSSSYGVLESCTISGSSAVCVQRVDGPSTGTATETGPVSLFSLQGGGPVSTGSPTTTPTATSVSRATSGTTPLSSAPQATAIPTGTSAAQRPDMAGTLIAAVVVLGSLFSHLI